MRKIFILIALMCAMTSMTSFAITPFLQDLEVNGRVGVSLGGTMPLGMPPEIRKLNRYDFKFNPMIGVDIEKRLDERWGVLVGIRLERKAMEIDATVKNYHIEIVRGGEKLEGNFTGKNHTSERQWELAIPILATFHVDKVRIFAGPYLAYVTDAHFTGYASDGYIRVGDPTGPKVELGSSETERGSYDFSDEMRRFQWGIQFGADWQLSRRWGVSAMVNWGLNGIHYSSFKVIEQKLYPIYATVGAVYYW